MRGQGGLRDRGESNPYANILLTLYSFKRKHISLDKSHPRGIQAEGKKDTFIQKKKKRKLQSSIYSLAWSLSIRFFFIFTEKSVSFLGITLRCNDRQLAQYRGLISFSPVTVAFARKTVISRSDQQADCKEVSESITQRACHHGGTKWQLHGSEAALPLPVPSSDITHQLLCCDLLSLNEASESFPTMVPYFLHKNIH